MAKDTAGKVLEGDDLTDYLAHLNQRLPMPEKYEGVVFDNTAPTGAQYRYQTAEEQEAGDAAAKESKDASDRALAAEAAARKAAGVPEGGVLAGGRTTVEADNVPRTPGAPGGDAGDNTRETAKGTKTP